jgi:hypothetical protein
VCVQTTATSTEKARATPRLRTWHYHALALACYTLLALLVLHPLPLQFTSHVAANGPGSVDAYLGVWNLWWFGHAVQNGVDPFRTPLLFYPQGLDLFWLWLSLPQGVLGFPFTLLFGPLVSYNVMVVASYVLGGYFAFLFVGYVLRSADRGRATGDRSQTEQSRESLVLAERGEAVGAKALSAQTRNRAFASFAPFADRFLAALVAGAVYALAPFHLQKVLDAQLEVASIQWVPLYLLALHVLLDRQRWYWALLAGLALLWVGLGTWYYGLFCLVYTGFAAGLWAIRPGTAGNAEAQRCRDAEQSGWFTFHVSRFTFRFSRFTFHVSLPTFLWGMAPVAVWLVLMLPRLVSLLQTGDTYLGDARGTKALSAADFAAFWLPSPLHPLWGAAVTQLYQGWYPEAIMWNVSFGLVGIALALLGILTTWRWNWRWAVLVVLLSAMAMGTTFNVFGLQTGLPNLYALIADLPGIRSGHRPNHFAVLAILLTALLAGFGTLALLRRWPHRPGVLVSGLVAAVFLVDGWGGPLPLFTKPIPAYYASMPAPDGGAILPIPVGLNFSNSENLWYQTQHHWPIIAGHSGREPPYPLGVYAPGVRELRFGVREPNDILRYGWPNLARESLAARNIRYVMVHRSSGSSLPLMREFMAEMGLQASYRDELIDVYPVPTLEQPRPLVYLGAGWGGLEQEGGRRWRWLSDGAELRLFNPTAQTRAVALELRMESFERERPLRLALNADSLGELLVGRAEGRRVLRFLLPPGEHVLYLSADPDPVPGQPNRRLSIAVLEVSLRDQANE